MAGGGIMVLGELLKLYNIFRLMHMAGMYVCVHECVFLRYQYVLLPITAVNILSYLAV